MLFLEKLGYINLVIEKGVKVISIIKSNKVRVDHVLLKSVRLIIIILSVFWSIFNDMVIFVVLDKLKNLGTLDYCNNSYY